MARGGVVRLSRRHAILFDLDDTLFDHRACTRHALAVFRARYPALARIPFGRLEEQYHRVLEEMHPRVLAGDLDHASAREERIFRMFRLADSAITRDEARTLAEAWRDAYDSAYRPVRGARPLLESLRASVVIGIVTNNRTDEQLRKLQRCRLVALVDFLLTSEDFGRTKPDPAIFREAVRRSACASGDVIVVGDSWTSDVAGARAAGLRAVWFNRTGMPPPDGAVPEIRAWTPTRHVSDWLRAHVGA